jgi:hypothetical protein
MSSIDPVRPLCQKSRNGIISSSARPLSGCNCSAGHGLVRISKAKHLVAAASSRGRERLRSRLGLSVSWRRLGFLGFNFLFFRRNVFLSVGVSCGVWRAAERIR